MTTPPATRERLIGAMIHTLQHRGLHGTGLSAILGAAGAPKGVMYHHFPGGKAELAVAAIDTTIALLCERLDACLQREASVAAALRLWIQRAQKGLQASGFDMGCPLAAVALESTAADVALRRALADGFARLRERIATALQADGSAEARARSLAALIVAAYEGGLLQARVANDMAPMKLAIEAVLALLDDEHQNRETS